MWNERANGFLSRDRISSAVDWTPEESLLRGLLFVATRRRSLLTCNRVDADSGSKG